MCKGNFHGNRRYNYLQNFFEKIDSEEKSYWLGFIFADGGVYSDGRRMHQISVKLSVKDLDHLKKFKKSIKSDHPIKIRKKYVKFPNGCSGIYESCSLRITSVKMFNDLINSGCIQNKSLSLKFPDETIVPNKFLNHFIRGYFDGDGCVSIVKVRKTNTRQVSILGTKEFLETIQSILLKECGISKTKIFKKNKIYSISYGGNLVTNNIKNYLYNNATIFLDRKKETFYRELNNSGTSGEHNGAFDHKIYTFINEKTSETFTGTQYDFKIKFNLKSISKIINKLRKHQYGWRIEN
jgi:hypothetical protein